MGGGAAGGGRIEAWLRVHVHGELAWESEDPAWFVDGDAFRTLVAIDWPSGDVREHDSYTTPAPRGPCE